MSYKKPRVDETGYKKLTNCETAKLSDIAKQAVHKKSTKKIIIILQMGTGYH